MCSPLSILIPLPWLSNQTAKTHWADRWPRSTYSSGPVRQSSSAGSNFAYRSVVGPMATAVANRSIKSPSRRLADDDISICFSFPSFSLVVYSKPREREKKKKKKGRERERDRDYRYFKGSKKEVKKNTDIFVTLRLIPL